MLDFLDESLTNIVHEYEEQVAKYDRLCFCSSSLNGGLG